MLLLAETDEGAKAVADAMHQWALVIGRPGVLKSPASEGTQKWEQC